MEPISQTAFDSYHRLLKQSKFYGKITVSFECGNITHIEECRGLKGRDMSNLIGRGVTGILGYM